MRHLVASLSAIVLVLAIGGAAAMADAGPGIAAAPTGLHKDKTPETASAVGGDPTATVIAFLDRVGWH